MKFIVLAGGSGTRLWPLSRKNFPKQFLKLPLNREGNRESFFQKTIKRLSLYREAEIFIVTSEKYRFYIQSQIEEIKSQLPRKNKIELIFEPAQKNTAPAIALAIRYALKKGVSKDEVFFISPSDHLIFPEEKFVDYLYAAEKVASEGHLITFGIKPNKPETGYGYIKTLSDSEGKGYYVVERFVEKPDLSTAIKYLEEGSYWWNSGMFAFSISKFIEEIKLHNPPIGQIFDDSYARVLESFQELPDISIDYALMEKTDKSVLIPFEIFWSDIGSWESLYEIGEKDKRGNVNLNDALALDTKNTLILGNRRLITTLGVEDLIIVDTEDALLVAKRGESQRVKDVVKILSEKSASQAEEHLTVFRPWGSFTLLEKGERYKIKRITVYPGEKLSLQMHHHRSEHWIVVRGTAKVSIGDREFYVHENESVYVPKSTVHRLENPGKIPLELIEVQVGEYVEEDDIKRLEDIYGRENFQGV